MLKALELAGFKSFADRTRFEFPEGITVVVGPNGSGKSNIVDAIKWVLGEQSAKSLRGKDMADVIFKGSGGTTGRKAANAAEATIVIDNSERRLNFDAEEVHLTRRVYRSGEGEYLINRQPCRLKDIRDLVRGTGIGTDAYSLIEQGKVDRMLQATANDRRAIFEEAAGISRFKAKKVEAQRRLGRVDQNLLRLSDIVEEVESRLRSVQSQAGKARRYKEYSQRLKELRTYVGMVDWRKFSEQIEIHESELSSLREESQAVAARAEAVEARLLEVEFEAESSIQHVRAGEGKSAKIREQLATLESSIEHARARCHDLAEEEARHRQHLAQMSTRSDDLQQRLRETARLLEAAESEYDEVRGALLHHEKTVRELNERLENERTQAETRRARHVEQMRRIATLGNQVSTYESELASAETIAKRCREQIQTLQSDCDVLATELKTLKTDHVRASKETEEKAAELTTVQRRLEETRDALNQRRGELSKLQLRHSGCNERLALLKELEQNREGVGDGVKQFLEVVAEDESWGRVHGLAAELIQADVEFARLIDLALGDLAQCVVLSGRELLERLPQEELPVERRVGFLLLDDNEPRVDDVDLSHQEGVVGRADQMVTVAEPFARLARRLLARTWFVEDLSTALRLRDSGRNIRLVTRNGDVIETDGVISVAGIDTTMGIVSRRSEIRALGQEVLQLEQQIEIVQQEIDRRQAEAFQFDKTQQRLSAEHKEAYAVLSQSRVQTELAENRFNEADQQRDGLQAELDSTDSRIADLTANISESRGALEQVEAEVAALEQALDEHARLIESLDAEHHRSSEHSTTAKVQSAKGEQRVHGLRTQIDQLMADQQERERTILETRNQLAHCLTRYQNGERTILKATSQAATLYLQKEGVAAETAQLLKKHNELASNRKTVSDELQQQRKLLRKLETKQHETELAAGEVHHERNTLAGRLSEDYGIELAKQEWQPSEEEERPRDEIETEIAELRQKINRIGAVNVDALEELDELDERHNALASQYNDLQEAKASLERIISKINADSRRLFVETLELIRQNFQVLYRKAFGGGRADLVLEEGVDVLEAGIDIIATPPGKPEFSNSLLSGGEKALTAVSLLMAIFQYRPSPFCVLDEVDAPFDEANIGRFIDVLKDFLGWTKFVIVTHSKKTMSAANTLYGVTMQESGVSKQVSVRFEDVSEDGHISPEAIEREEGDDADAA